MIKEFAKKLLAAGKCNLCGHKVYKYLPLNEAYTGNLAEKGFPISVDKFETLNYKAYSCPSCGCNDRDRLIGWYIKQEILGEKNLSVLEMAPASSLRNFLKRQPQVRYRTADLYMEDVDDKVDIQNMNIYQDNSFDLVICSHVLEHIPDDNKALRELHRITRPGGQCILLVPIPLLPVAYDEELGPIATTERERRFGQDDHVRLYTAQIFEERIRAAGFQIEKFSAGRFRSQDLERNGISAGSLLYIGKK
jgi:SAM-dependent methyltransferase